MSVFSNLTKIALRRITSIIPKTIKNPEKEFQRDAALAKTTTTTGGNETAIKASSG
jgi:hypothetical protein